jgi:hypothetical protein
MKILRPENFIGRSVQQVDEFLKNINIKGEKINVEINV